MDSPYWKGPLPGVDVQRRYLWKTFRGKPNSIPGSARKCSASARNPVRLHPGMLFGFSPESCSTCPGMLFGLPRNTHTAVIVSNLRMMLSFIWSFPPSSLRNRPKGLTNSRQDVPKYYHSQHGKQGPNGSLILLEC